MPPDFARIPTSSPAAVVLAAVAGTPQAQEAVIANSVPQTATVPLANGPTFVPSFDGAPQFKPIADTPLSATTNASVPIIQVDPNNFYAVSSGVWFTAPAVTGPWRVATSVPDVIYTIPTSSVAHFVTYVRIYGATPEVVYVGYTPGYMGTVVGPYGTVVYGTGYAYTPWVGSVWYPPPYTYGMAAAPVYSAALGFTYGFRDRAGHCGLGHAVLRCGLPSLRMLWQRHGQRLWSVRQHGLFGDEDGVRRRRSRRSFEQRQLLQQSHRHERQLLDEQELQREYRCGETDRSSERHGRERRNGQRRRGAQLQHGDRAAVVRLGRFGHRRRRRFD